MDKRFLWTFLERAKLLPEKTPCLLSPRAPCFAPQAEKKGERPGSSHEEELI